MKPLKLLGALVAAAMLTGVTNIMAYDIPVSEKHSGYEGRFHKPLRL